MNRLAGDEEREDGEHILVAVRPHWFLVVSQGRFGLVLVAGGMALMLFGKHVEQWLIALKAYFPPATETFLVLPASRLSLHTAIAWGVLIIIVVGLTLVGWAALDRHFTVFMITTSPGSWGQIVKVQGILSRQTVVVPLVMINDLELCEPLPGRILGWGHIDIETGNDYRGDRLEYVPNPRAFHGAWQALLDSHRAGYGSGYGSGYGAGAGIARQKVGPPPPTARRRR